MDLPFKKKIVYLVVYDYLSVPIYNRTAKILAAEFEHCLVYFPDPYIKGDFNLNKIMGENDCFNSFLDYTSKNFEEIKKIISRKQEKTHLIRLIFLLKKYRDEVLTQLRILAPDFIFTTTDLSFVSRLAGDFASGQNIPFILFQSSFIDSCSEGFAGRFKRNVLSVFFDRFLKLPLFNRTLFNGPGCG